MILKNCITVVALVLVFCLSMGNAFAQPAVPNAGLVGVNLSAPTTLYVEDEDDKDKKK